MRNFSPARKRVDVSPGESVRIIRELQGLSQVQLAELCGIPQTTISSIENSRVNLGVERAMILTLALRCPSVQYLIRCRSRADAHRVGRVTLSVISCRCDQQRSLRRHADAVRDWEVPTVFGHREGRDAQAGTVGRRANPGIPALATGQPT